MDEVYTLNEEEKEMYDELVKKYDLLELEPSMEAEKLGNMYLDAKDDDERAKIIKVAAFIGGRWDIITKSVIFYPLFERIAGKTFRIFWGDGYDKHVEDFENRLYR